MIDVLRVISALSLLVLTVSTATAGQWSGYVAVEGRVFADTPLDPRQQGDSLSVSAQPEFFSEWDNRRSSFTFVPFFRLDQKDPARSHVDIRELTWLRAGPWWEWRVGVRKVIWGVTESLHLVDIINQTDNVENFDREDKLGQPMINLALIRDWGTVDLFVLPYFRERTFPGVRGRLRTPLPVDEGLASYESARERRHVDVALRWSHTLGDWDVALSYFNGTGREPRLAPALNARGEPVLAPHYEQIEQLGVEVQLTRESWLWKLEAIGRSSARESFNALVAGVEYTLYGIFDSAADLGLLAEYLYDERGDGAPTPFEDDVLLGFRLAMNDAQSTEALFGVLTDRDSSAIFYNLEASRRLGDRFVLSMEGRIFSGAPARDPAAALRQDDHLQIELAWYF